MSPPANVLGRPPLVAGAALLSAFLGACAASPSPPPPPPLSLAADHFQGSVLTGALTVDAPVETLLSDPWVLELELVQLPVLPAGGVALSASARHVLVERSVHPLRSRAELATTARRLSELPESLAATWREVRVEALLLGTSTAVRARREEAGPLATRAPWELLEVEVSRAVGAPERAEVALVLEGLVTPRVERDETLEDEDSAPSAPPPPVRQRERIVLDAPPEPGGPPLVIALPAPTALATEGGFLLCVRLARGPDDAAAEEAFAEDAARASARILAAAERSRDAARVLSVDERFRLATGGALAALEDPPRRRAALVLLAVESGAETAATLALAADDVALAEHAPALRDELLLLEPFDRAVLGLTLERAALRFMATRALADQAALAPELYSVLLRTTGELGRYPDLVLEAAQEARDLEALSQRFRDENRTFLEDGHPAARVRAFDWLALRGLAPEGYDPLGTRDERRAALDAADEAASELSEEELP